MLVGLLFYLRPSKINVFSRRSNLTLSSDSDMLKCPGNALHESRSFVCLLSFHKGLSLLSHPCRAAQILFDEDWDDLHTGKVKLSQVVVQRWISICKMLLALLERWESLQAFYTNKNEEFPLATLRTEVRSWSVMTWLSALGPARPF